MADLAALLEGLEVRMSKRIDDKIAMVQRVDTGRSCAMRCATLQG